MTNTDLNAVRNDDALAAIWSDTDIVADEVSMTGYRFLPTCAAPRLVIPELPRAASKALLRALRDRSTSKARLKTEILAVSLHAPTPRSGRAQLPPPAIAAMLQRLLDREDLVVGIHLGPARANRKPVIAICDQSGALVGFAKIAVSDLTQKLVLNEANALRQLPTGRRIHTPHLLAEGTWRELPLTIQTPVPEVGRRIDDPAAVADAQVELASSGEVANRAADYLHRLDARLSQVADCDPDNQATARSLMATVAELAQLAAVESIRCGRWHGDWRRTNMAVGRDGVAVWDWERFDVSVPLGFDALHLSLTTRAAQGQNLTVLVNGLFGDAHQTLAPFEIYEPDQRTFVTTAYLVEFATRSLEDKQSRSGTRLGDVRRWLVPELEARRTRTA